MPVRPPRFLLLLAASALASLTGQAAPPGTATPRIVVDQFGYTSEMAKVAVISDPQTGFNSAEAYTPGASLEVRQWGTNAVVFSGARTAWNGGATHAQSGDKVWWFDFSNVKAWGEYYLYDPANDARSDRFRIAHDVYGDVLKQAVRVFFYQRRGFAKQPPYTDAKWADGASHLGTLQDSQCRLISAPANAALQKDLRGGWFDAGDYNKYTNFTFSPLTDLLFAYEDNPLIWGDDANIPESGNGLPDLLDEVKWELDWLLRMQNANGSVLSKVAVNNFQGVSPPSTDTTQIFYGAESTSATFSTAATFAHAARIYGSAGQTAYATTLRNAAIAAWTWGVANPSVTFTNAGFASANPEVDSYTRSMYQLCAAIYLYALTGETSYRTYVEANYGTAHPIQWGYWYGFEAALESALIYYTAQPGVPTATVNAIRASKQTSMGGSEFLPAFTGATDAYRAYLKDGDYVWGSNGIKGYVGQLFRQQLTYNLDPANAANYRAAANGYLHYLHGVNPLSMVFLSNMYAFGGERCANEIYHVWFGDGTAWDNALTSTKGPPPGYVPGGANPTWHPDASYSGPALIPPASQPTQKSYRDWNTSFPQNSWEITEPGIYYQASYVRLLSGALRPMTYADFVEGYALSGGDAAETADVESDGLKNLEEFAFARAPRTADAAGLAVPVVSTHFVAGQNRRYLTITFPRRVGANLTYTVLASSDLATWTPMCMASASAAPSGTGFVSEANTGSLRTITVRDDVEVTDTSVKRFLRIQVTKN